MGRWPDSLSPPGCSEKRDGWSGTTRRHRRWKLLLGTRTLSRQMKREEWAAKKKPIRPGRLVGSPDATYMRTQLQFKYWAFCAVILKSNIQVLVRRVWMCRHVKRRYTQMQQSDKIMAVPKGPSENPATHISHQTNCPMTSTINFPALLVQISSNYPLVQVNISSSKTFIQDRTL